MNDANGRSRPDRFGLMVALAGALVFVVVLVLTLPPLSRWADTLIVMATLFCPVIVAGLLYERIERRDGWSHRNRLR